MDSPAPYAGGQKGFSIGLRPVPWHDWIRPDGQLADRLAEKKHLTALYPHETYVDDGQSLPAQAELWTTLVRHLTQTFPALYSLDEGSIRVGATGRQIPLDTDLSTPLQRAAQVVDEDLCVLVPDGSGWRLSAASVCFPSHWSLGEKFCRGLDDIHAPVPGYTENMSVRVRRIMNSMQSDQLLERNNWSLHDDPTLYHTSPSARPRFDAVSLEELIDSAFVRVERQTLMKLPTSAAIVFTIRTYIASLATLSPEHLADMARALETMTTDELAYRGIAHKVSDIIHALRLRSVRL